MESWWSSPSRAAGWRLTSRRRARGGESRRIEGRLRAELPCRAHSLGESRLSIAHESVARRLVVAEQRFARPSEDLPPVGSDARRIRNLARLFLQVHRVRFH